ncbi:MAG TPA: hypothetical protein VMW89_17720 [Desulfatiglandales bacterium]|nr:hypothetical protein [Desulfatiglandales bacterium]
MREQITLNEAVLEVAKQMGVDPEDIKRYGQKGLSSETASMDEVILQVAKLMFVDLEDIKRYGYR